MNKKVIALAVAGALASPLAAQAQTANVTMYGTFRVAMESVDITDLGRKNSIDSWSSRWGIRGIESLGGGLNGIFQLELGVNLDRPGDTANTVNIRESWVGLNGGFGTVKMGAGLTPYDDVFGMDHLLLANGTENMNQLGGGPSPTYGTNFSAYMSNGAVGGAGLKCNDSTAFDARYGNSIRYDSPNFSGLTFATQFAFLGENATGNKCKGWDSAVIYKNGPIEAGLAYARHIDMNTYDGNATRLHLGYDFGFLKLLGAYEIIKLDGNNGSSGKAKTRYYVVGAMLPLGPGVLTAQYGNRDKGATATAAVVSEFDNAGGKQYSVSYKYGFSKRTYAYTWAAQLKPESGGFAVSGAQAGRKATGIGFGLQHNF